MARLILLAISLGLLALVVRLVFVSAVLRDNLAELSASNQLSMAGYVASDIGGKLAERTELIRRLAETLPPGLLAGGEGLNRWLEERQEVNPLFSRGLLLVNRDGKALASYPQVGRLELDYRDSDWFTAVLHDKRPAVSKPFHGRLRGLPLMVMAAPIMAPDGGVAAVLAGVTEIAAPGFLDLVQTTKIGERGGLLLVSPKDGVFVTATDPAKILAPLPPPGANPLHDRAMAGFRGTGITVNLQGVEELSAMASVPGTDWFVVARVPTEEALAAVKRAQRTILLASIWVMIVVIGSLAVLLPRMFRPLTSSAEQIRRMAEGTLPLQPLRVVRKDEIGELAIGFNFLLEKLRENEARMAHMAHHDSLTGIPNRAMLDDRLDQEIARAQRSGKKLAVVFLDLNGFKPINDSHGHNIGDEVLRQVAGRLSAAVRRADTVARFGGDEFVVILAGLDEADETVAQVVAKIQSAMARPFPVGELRLGLGVSVGSAVYPDQAQDAETLLSLADHAMYAAKSADRVR